MQAYQQEKKQSSRIKWKKLLQFIMNNSNLIIIISNFGQK